MNLKGNVFLNSLQIWAYAGDIAIIASDVESPKNVFNVMEQKAGNAGVIVIGGKTKYVVLASGNLDSLPRKLIIEERKSDEV